MQLVYRGISYVNEPYTIESIPSDITGRFLGQKYQIRRPFNSILSADRQSLIYRGLIH